MDIKEAVSLFTVLVPLFSVIVSVFTSVAFTRREIKKARQQLTSTYAEKLLDARLAAYPNLYAVLSGFIKHIEGGSEKYMAGQSLTVSDARSLLAAIIPWDNQNALYLSDRAGRAIFDLRQQLINIVKEISSTGDGDILSGKTLDSLLYGAQQLELALKVDLGVYEVELYERRTSISSYLHASALIESRTKESP